MMIVQTGWFDLLLVSMRTDVWNKCTSRSFIYHVRFARLLMLDFTWKLSDVKLWLLVLDTLCFQGLSPHTTVHSIRRKDTFLDTLAPQKELLSASRRSVHRLNALPLNPTTFSPLRLFKSFFTFQCFIFCVCSSLMENGLALWARWDRWRGVRHRQQEASGEEEAELGSDGGRKKRRRDKKERERGRDQSLLPCQYSQCASSSPERWKDEAGEAASS